VTQPSGGGKRPAKAAGAVARASNGAGQLDRGGDDASEVIMVPSLAGSG